MSASAAGTLPEAFVLHAAAPNPFAAQTTLRYDLPEVATVRLAVYDVLGREVAVLLDGAQEAGTHEAVLERRSLPSGTHLVRLTAGAQAFMQQATVVR